MTTDPDYYALLGVHPTTDEFVVRLAHKARRQELSQRQWPNPEELQTRLEELRIAEAILTHPEKSSAYYLASRVEKNAAKKIVIELDLFDQLFFDIQRRLRVVADTCIAGMSELQKLEYSRRVLEAESIMTFYSTEQRSYAQWCNENENHSEILRLFSFRKHSDTQIRKMAHDTRNLNLRKDWVALDITEDVLEFSAIWIASEQERLKGLNEVGIRRTKLWLERTRSEVRRQLSTSICANCNELWAEAPLTCGEAPEFESLDTLLRKAVFSIARAEYCSDET